VITVPAFLAVQISVSSRDGHPHVVLVQTRTPRRLTVKAGRRVTVLIRGQRAGRYPVQVDGHTRGALVVGGEPGP
jgi:hypothetical protein